ATAVVPLPMNGSNTTSPLLDQLIMWSLANASGKMAGCLCAVKSFAACPLPLKYLQTFVLTPNSLIFLFPLLVNPPSFSLLVIFPVLVPAQIFGLSSKMFTVLGRPLVKMNIYSKELKYLPLCGGADPLFSYMITS